MSGPTTPQPAFQPVPPFTAAQLRVAEALMDPRGLTYAQIGRELNLDHKTVNCYVRDMAALLPGRLPQRVRVLLWCFGYRRQALAALPYPTGPRGRMA